MVRYFDERVLFHAFFVFVLACCLNTLVSCAASPGSRSNPSRVKLGALMESLKNSGMTVHVNGGILSELALQDAAEIGQDAAEICQAEIDPRTPRTLLSLAEEDFKATDETPELVIEFSKLAELSEKEFQDGPLTKQLFDIQWARALDLSVKAIPGPFYKPAQSVGGAHVSHLSAKPDGTSLAAPMDLEIKSDTRSGRLAEVDWDVLNQAVERVVMRLRMAGFLSYAVAFAVTGRSAWCVVGERRFQSGREIMQLNLCRITYRYVSLLWGAVTRRAAREPYFFLTADGPLLLRSLGAAGLEPWACRVKWLASSMSNVYGITLPQQFKLGKKMCRGIDCLPASVTFVVKAVRGDNANLFAREVSALQKMADAPHEFKFYALGSFPGDEESSRQFNLFRGLGRVRSFICSLVVRPLLIPPLHPPTRCHFPCRCELVL